MRTKYKNHYFTQSDISTFDLDQIYMVSSLWHDNGMKNHIGTFDLIIRDMPKNRNFLVFTGLEEIIMGIKSWRYTDYDIKLLLHEQLISKSFAKYLKKFRFTGTMHAMPEGTIFFPGETVIRIKAPLIQANLLTAFLITSLSSNTIFSTKFIRSVLAAKGRSVIGPSPVRAHGFESAFKAQRAASIVGSDNGPSPIFRSKFGLDKGNPATIAYHAYIKSFPSEFEAMKKASDFLEFDLSLMIDTYDINQGLKNAIKIIKEREQKGKGTKIVINSGDLSKLSKMVRKKLDQAGCQTTSITVASNLDEFKIKKLIDQKSPIDTFIVVTEVVTSSDDPRLEVVYKLAQVDIGSKKVYKMKLAEGKMSYPGSKQIYRVVKNGKYSKDVIGLDGEKLGIPLLKKYITNGKVNFGYPSVSNIRNYVSREINKFPAKYSEIDKNYIYPVKYSKRLEKLVTEVKQKIINQYH